jgi:hypothetical protein
MLKKCFKFTSVLALSFILATTISCAKEDEEKIATPEKPVVQIDPLISAKEKLVGKWDYTKRGSILNGVEDLKEYPHQCASNKDNIEFKVDNSLVAESRFANCVAGTTTNSFAIRTIGNDIVVRLNEVNDYRILSLTDTELKYISLTADVGQITLCKKIK